MQKQLFANMLHNLWKTKLDCFSKTCEMLESSNKIVLRASRGCVTCFWYIRCLFIKIILLVYKKHVLSEWGQERTMLVPGCVIGGGLAVTAGFSLSRGGLVACVHSIHTLKPSNGRFSGPWCPFDTKLALPGFFFRGAGREMGPGACNAWFYMIK